MMLLNFGCSLALGAELNDCPWPFRTSSAHTWPALIAKRLGLEYRCYATGGCGNLSIMERVLYKTHELPDCICLINWTFIDRFDYSDPNGYHYNKGSNDYLTLRPGNTDTVSEYYFQNLHSEYRDKLCSLTYILATLNQLIRHNVKFVMTSVDPVLFCDTWHAPNHIKLLQNQIEPFIQQFEGRTFLDWCKHRAHEISPQGHPLEQAHIEAADLMQPVVDRILHSF